MLSYILFLETICYFLFGIIWFFLWVDISVGLGERFKGYREKV